MKVWPRRSPKHPTSSSSRPANLALLAFRYPPGLDDQALDTLNERRLLHALNDSGRIYLTQTRVRGRYARAGGRRWPGRDPTRR